MSFVSQLFSKKPKEKIVKSDESFARGEKVTFSNGRGYRKGFIVGRTERGYKIEYQNGEDTKIAEVPEDEILSQSEVKAIKHTGGNTKIAR